MGGPSPFLHFAANCLVGAIFDVITPLMCGVFFKHLLNAVGKLVRIRHLRCSNRGRNLLVQSSLTQNAFCDISAQLGLNALGQLCLQNLGRRNELAVTMLQPTSQ